MLTVLVQEPKKAKNVPKNNSFPYYQSKLYNILRGICRCVSYIPPCCFGITLSSKTVSPIKFDTGRLFLMEIFAADGNEILLYNLTSICLYFNV